MSAFGDKNVLQDLYEDLETTQQKYGLTDEELVIVVLRVLGAFIDPASIKSSFLQKRPSTECSECGHWAPFHDTTCSLRRKHD